MTVPSEYKKNYYWNKILDITFSSKGGGTDMVISSYNGCKVNWVIFLYEKFV